jgi:hypothetical protein
MEFEDIMGELKALIDSPQMQQHLKRNERYLLSWDNDKIHRGADLETVGIMPEDRLELPELSSDMHKVVEHQHAWLQFKMQMWLETQDAVKLTEQQCKDELERLFYQELKQQSVLDDVRSLKATYQAVIDHKGGFIPAADR